MTEPKSILLLRADAIGDHVLASGLLPLLRERWPSARITILCPALVSGLFSACPFVDRVIPFHPASVRRRVNRLRLRWLLRHRYDLAVNTVFSRDTLVDFLARRVRAKRFVAFQGDASNQSVERLRKRDHAYSELLQTPSESMHALDPLNALARHLGLKGDVKPTAWFSREDLESATRMMEERGFETNALLAFFPGSGTVHRRYLEYGDALRAFLEVRPSKVIALGSVSDRSLAEEALQGLPAESLNLCGETSLGQAAAILSRCRLAMGAESGLAHLAWAVGTPQAIVLGGGHYGRFMPRSPTTTVACLPMDCYGCNWNCTMDRPHCIQDLPPETLAAAMIAAWDGRAESPRIHYPDPSTAPAGHSVLPPSLPGGLPALPIAIPLRQPGPPEA